MFVTDCDKTLVHYEDDGVLTENLVYLPRSSGTGQLGSFSKATLHLLDRISTFVPVVCASGMRSTTMLQRQPFFPSITYWICENGGRIFYRDKESMIMKEYREWVDELKRNTESMEALQTFSAKLSKENWKVDSRDYETMVRISGPDVASIIPSIPENLAFTFNLGHLDIQLPGVSKLTSTKWLMKRIYGDKIDATSLEVKLLFMGDDTNDIETAKAADYAFIANPCSTDMRQWLDSLPRDLFTGGNSYADELASTSAILEQLPQGSVLGADETSHEGLKLKSEIPRPIAINSKVFVASATRHLATESLLQVVLRHVQNV